jgi:GntR family transcriptional regulator / MocR family aminotransferase
MTRPGYRSIAQLFALRRTSDEPLHLELYRAIRGAIERGNVTDGQRLPPTRVLADSLEVSRGTVLAAYGRLTAEGLLEGRRGGGTRVAAGVRRSKSAASVRRLSGDLPDLDRMTRSAAKAPVPFVLGVPALDRFPVATWSRLGARRWRTAPRLMMAPADDAGLPSLRQAIADFVASARGIECKAEQILVTAGGQQAISLIAKTLLTPGDSVWVEDYGYPPARAAFDAVGAHWVGVPVDAEGLDVSRGRALAPAASLALVTPACAYPFCVRMSTRRRLALLDWAHEARAWIVEDDFNGELCYEGRSPPALAAMRHPGAARVLYVRTFNKTLFPSLRLGFVVLPHDLVGPISRARLIADRHSPTVQQAVLTDFIVNGHLTRHMHEISQVHQDRQYDFLRLAHRILGSALALQQCSAGLRVAGLLDPTVSDRLVVAEVRRRGLQVEALSSQSITSSSVNGLVFGYSPFRAEQVREGLSRLSEAVMSAHKASASRLGHTL